MIYTVPVKGVFETNCYFCIDEATKHGFLIDPGAQGQALSNLIRRQGWRIETILLTHGHFDHTGGIATLRRELHIPVMAYENADLYLLNPVKNLSRHCGPDITVTGAEFFHDGDVLSLEANPSCSLRALWTPGHTEDSVIFYSEKEKTAFVGDTIFRGSIGNSSYPGGNREQLVHSITYTIFSLPEETTLLSGHSEPTTVGAEKRRYRW
jgi:glyoxylase-like metal-dependent hydrolase (beta-lactamase superfamily II)